MRETKVWRIGLMVCQWHGSKAWIGGVGWQRQGFDGGSTATWASWWVGERERERERESLGFYFYFFMGLMVGCERD